MKKMTDLEFARLLVTLGIAKCVDHFWFGLPDDSMSTVVAHRYCRDWRVAGVIITKLRERGFSWLLASLPGDKALMTITAPISSAAEYVTPAKCRSWSAQVTANEDALAIVKAGAIALSERVNDS